VRALRALRTTQLPRILNEHISSACPHPLRPHHPAQPRRPPPLHALLAGAEDGGWETATRKVANRNVRIRVGGLTGLSRRSRRPPNSPRLEPVPRASLAPRTVWDFSIVQDRFLSPPCQSSPLLLHRWVGGRLRAGGAVGAARACARGGVGAAAHGVRGHAGRLRSLLPRARAHRYVPRALNNPHTAGGPWTTEGHPQETTEREPGTARRTRMSERQGLGNGEQWSAGGESSQARTPLRLALPSRGEGVHG
jgi:hypothetical protein